MQLLALALATVLDGSARASLPEIAGMGGRSSALAGTGASFADGFDAVYENPAGLVEPTQRRLTVGYILGRYDLYLDGASRGVADTNGVMLGVALPLPFGGFLTRRIAFGLGFYFPTSVLNRAQAPFSDEPRLALLDERTQVVSALGALGFRITDRLTLGVGVLVLATLTGIIRIAPDAGGHIVTLAEEQIVASYSPLIGARWRATDWLRIGATIHDVSEARYDIEIDAALGKAIPITLPVLHVSGVAQYDPLQAVLEASAQPRPWVTLIGSLTYKRWSAFPLPVNNAATPAGMDGPPSPAFHDTIVPRVAVELVRARPTLSLALRGGWSWEPTPSSPTIASPTDPTMSVPTPYVDADRQVLTVGAGLTHIHTFGALQIDTFAQLHFLTGNPRATGKFVLAGLSVGVDL